MKKKMLTNTIKAMQIAVKAHQSQFRRDGVTPYYNHLEGVWRGVLNESDEVQATAWLHDYLEDAEYTHGNEKVLRDAGISEAVIEAVSLLNKNSYGNIPYTQYLEKIKDNEIARKVKIADMQHNLSDSPTKRQIEKYSKGIVFLNQ